MKKTFFILLISIILAACQSNEDKADAYGNFETTEVMVSAMAQGEIFSLDLEEGQELKLGKVVGLIDTTDLYLKEKQF